MASRWKSLAIVGAFYAALATVFGILMVTPMQKEYRAYVFRVAFVCVLETLILVGALNLWSHMKHLPAQVRIKNVVCQRLWQTLVLVFIFLSQACYLTVFFTGTEPKPWVLITFVFLGTFIQMNVCLLTITGCRFVMRCFGVIPKQRKYTNGDPDPCDESYSKVHKEKAVTSIIAIVYAVTVASVGMYTARQPPVVRNVEIPIPGLPVEFNNLRIIQISDIHLGPTVGLTEMQRIVDNVVDLKPDLMVLVGDLVDGAVSQLKEAVAPLNSIRPPYGKYYVTGNHEYYTGDVDNWFVKVRELGFTVLHNEHVKIGHESGEYFYLAGTDDTEGGRIRYGDHGMDLEKAVGSCDAGRPIVLLAHRPSAAKSALDSEYNIKLVLSGHTHGGQMFPLMLPTYLLNPFFLGLYRYNGAYVYVSEGTVYWGIPMRILTTREITAITLKATS